MLACDILTGVGYDVVAKMQKGVTKALVNTALVMPADFTRNADLRFPLGSMEQEIRDAVATGDAEFLDATKLATGLMGDSIATNLFMVGYAYQRGLLPLSEASILRAIELNGAAIESNTQSFRWGRLAAVDPKRVLAAAIPADKPESQRLSAVARRNHRPPLGVPGRLSGRRVCQALRRFRDQGARRGVGEGAGPDTALTEAVARYYFKLLAIKDEYEVARLYTDGEFEKRVAAQFEGDYKLNFHLAPPLTNAPDATTGEAKKSTYGPWMMRAFRVLAKMKGLRGTAFDIFGRTAERRMERQLITDYEALIDELLPRLAPHNVAIAVELASIPEHIRGYGHVKERHLKAAKVKRGRTGCRVSRRQAASKHVGGQGRRVAIVTAPALMYNSASYVNGSQNLKQFVPASVFVGVQNFRSVPLTVTIVETTSPPRVKLAPPGGAFLPPGAPLTLTVPAATTKADFVIQGDVLGTYNLRFTSPGTVQGFGAGDFTP